jgi:hypothetical protein
VTPGRGSLRNVGLRALVGVSAALSAGLAFVLPGSFAYAAGMLGYMLLPLLLLGGGAGKVFPTDGGVRYGTGRSRDQTTEVTIRLMGALAFGAFGYFSQSRDGTLFAVFGALIGNGCALLALLGLYTAVLAPVANTHGVTLEATMLTIDKGDGQQVLRYADVEKVEHGARRIVVTTSSERLVVPVGGGAAATLAQAIVDAKAKAAANAQNEDGRMRELRRASGMSAREWFARIDAVAAASRSPGAYRGGAIDEEHLWGVLADPEADVEARAAAARVLASSESPEVRTRVASSVSEITDERTHLRVELAMRRDMEEAAAELEALEMEELRKTAGV